MVLSRTTRLRSSLTKCLKCATLYAMNMDLRSKPIACRNTAQNQRGNFFSQRITKRENRKKSCAFLYAGYENFCDRPTVFFSIYYVSQNLGQLQSRSIAHLSNNFFYFLSFCSFVLLVVYFDTSSF